MSFYNGLMFFIVLVIGLIPAVILGVKEKKLKTYIMFFSLLLIYLIYKESPIELFYLLIYIFVEWHVIALYQWSRTRFGAVKSFYYHAIIFALLPLVIAKVSGLMGHHWFSFLGISYVTFKVLQIIIESYDGVIVKSSFSNTICFLLFFPALSSGPIDRSKRFEEDLVRIWKKTEYIDLLQKGIWKILVGCLYKFVLSAIAFNYLEQIAQRYDPQYVVLYAYVYGVYMFFDFAGYSLMAIGTSYILGIRTPENFNKPFISKDIKEFWDRWHITLSQWFRDFLFSRYMMSALRSKKFKNRLNAASAGFIINMFVMGIWHGLSKDYLLYGLYHGVLLALTERYQKKKWYRKVKNKKWYQIISWFVTLNLVMFGFLIFSGQFSNVLHVVISKLW